MRRSVIVAGVIFALLVITQVQASAQTGVVYGCVNNRTGTLRIVSGPEDCGPKEVAIFWNQVGPQGPPGQPGEPGPPGEGAIKVYDATNQFLGIYAGLPPGPGRVQGSFFVPALKLFVVMEDEYGQPDYGHVLHLSYLYYIDNTGRIFVAARDRLIRLPGDTYVAAVGDPVYVPAVNGWRYDSREISASELPFTLPVAMPLRYE